MSDGLEDDATGVSDCDSDEEGRKYIISIIRDVFIPTEGFLKIIKSLFKEYAFSRRGDILYLILPDNAESQGNYTQRFRRKYIKWYKTYECGTTQAVHVDAVMEVVRVVFVNPEATKISPEDRDQILRIIEETFEKRSAAMEERIATMEERIDKMVVGLKEL